MFVPHTTLAHHLQEPTHRSWRVKTPALASLLLACAAFALAIPAPAALDNAPDICAHFSGFDQNRDGHPEIASLKLIHHAGTGDRRILMLVEQRLLDPQNGADPLLPSLQQWCADLAAQGCNASVIAVTLAPSELHQDGRYVLALREFVRAMHRATPLEAVVLTGHFPDAFLVRTVNWWRTGGDFVLRAGTPEEKKLENVRYIRRVPEAIAQKSDIVLADLDGAWEKIYVQESTSLQRYTVIPGEGFSEQGGAALDVQQGNRKFENFFNLADGGLEATQSPDGSWEVKLDSTAANAECSPNDAARPNPIARPDILVSRIDARNTALRPRQDIAGPDGTRLLDATGKPQTVHFGEGAKIPAPKNLWEPDPAFERRLLREYFERNHAYRTGTAEITWRPASLACELGSGYRVVLKAATDWVPGDAKAADVSGKPTLNDAIQWMKYPAILRTVRAHSYPQASKFRKSSTTELEATLGAPPWAWVPQGDALVPSLKTVCGNGMLNWHLLRSIYESKSQAQQPAFYLHTGCDIVSPAGAATLPYTDPRYGYMQGAEALLFFGQGLALVGRSKVYYDEPANFTPTLVGGKSFGAAWAAYFEHDSNAQSPGAAGSDIGRKKSYFWSVLGDCTLRLHRPAQ